MRHYRLLALLIWLSTMFSPAIPAEAHLPSSATFHTGKRPEPILADPSHHRVYIGNESGGTISVVDDRTRVVEKIVKVGHEVEDLTLDRSSGYLYVANRVSSTVSVLDTGAPHVIATLPAEHPYGLAVDPGLRRLYVADTHDTVSVVDTGSRRVIHTISTPGGPQGIGVDTSSHRLFVALSKANALLAIDPRTYKTLATMPIGRLPVHPVRVDPKTHTVYVVNSVSSTLSVVDGAALKVLHTLPTGRYPEGLWIDPPAHRAYVSDEGDPGTDKNSGHAVTILDLRTGRTLATLHTLRGPDGVAFDTATADLYVCDENSGKVSVIRLPALLSGRR
jgi:YVTN family beta-propeller protein